MSEKRRYNVLVPAANIEQALDMTMEYTEGEGAESRSRASTVQDLINRAVAVLDLENPAKLGPDAKKASATMSASIDGEQTPLKADEKLKDLQWQEPTVFIRLTA